MKLSKTNREAPYPSETGHAEERKALALLMISSPGAGAFAVVWMIAAYSIAFGVLLIALDFRLEKPANGEELQGRAGA